MDLCFAFAVNKANHFEKKYFIPVKFSVEQPKEVLKILEIHTHWIEDEWTNKTPGFSLFTIKSGILKSSIKRQSENI